MYIFTRIQKRSCKREYVYSMSLVAHLIVSWWAGDQPRYEVGGWTQATLQSHHQAGLDHLHRGTKSALGQAHTTYTLKLFSSSSSSSSSPSLPPSFSSSPSPQDSDLHHFFSLCEHMNSGEYALPTRDLSTALKVCDMWVM